MKSATLLTILALLFVGPVHAASSAAADEQELKRVEATLCEAFRTNDAATIARLEDETYTLTNSRAVVSTRADDIADAKKGASQYSEFRNHDTTIRLYGDTAIILGITSVKGSADGKPFELDVRFTDTYVRRTDGWKIAASHVTRIPAN